MNLYYLPGHAIWAFLQGSEQVSGARLIHQSQRLYLKYLVYARDSNSWQYLIPSPIIPRDFVNGEKRIFNESYSIS